MTVRELTESINWEADEIALEIWNEEHTDLLCKWGWLRDDVFGGDPSYEDFADRLWYDALDCEVKYIYAEPDKFEDGNGLWDVVVLHIEAV